MSPAVRARRVALPHGRRRGAAAGVTTVVDMPLDSTPPTTGVEALRVEGQAADGEVAVDVASWGGAVPGNL